MSNKIEIKGNVQHANINIGNNNTQQQFMNGTVKWLVVGLGVLLILSVLAIGLQPKSSSNITGNGNTVIQNSNVEYKD